MFSQGKVFSVYIILAGEFSSYQYDDVGTAIENQHIFIILIQYEVCLFHGKGENQKSLIEDELGMSRIVLKRH